MSTKVLVPAIEFNFEMSILKQMSDIVVANEDYLLTDLRGVEVIPGYAEDFTKFKKPSIILQKLHSMTHCLGMGNFVGIRTNELGQEEDVFGVAWTLQYQFGVIAKNRTTMLMLNAIIMDAFLTESRVNNQGKLVLYDFTADINAPVEIGTIQLRSDSDSIDYASNDNSDYGNAINFEAYTVQTLAPAQEFIDLSKWMDVTYHIV